MRYHLALNRPLDLDGMARDAAAGKRPRIALGMLRDRLGATVHHPGSEPITLADRVRSRLFGAPEIWAMARALNRQLGADDVVFCGGEDTAIPIAATCGGRRDRPKVALFVHNLDRPRGRAALRLFQIHRRVDLLVTNIGIQVDFLRRTLGLPADRVRLIDDQTDLQFFTPGPASPTKTRPVIASVGLEQRDYRTLATATADLDLDVRISGFSTDAAVQGRAMPEVVPANMSQRFYDWPDLVQLYRDADIVVVSLFECRYSAGITTVMEALACGRPLIVTETAGIRQFLDPDAMQILPVGDPASLRRAIQRTLEDRSATEALAQRGYALGRRHDSDRFVATIAHLVEGL